MKQYLHSPSSSSSSEDYFNMEVDHHHSFNSSIFSQSNKEFEFQSFSSSSDRDLTTTSPADELFYMGKLLPLHLPPRLEMVHKILESTSRFDVQKLEQFDDEPYSTPLFTPGSTTPFESCNISPLESCHVSRELDPSQYFEEYYSGTSIQGRSIDDHKEKKSWPKKLMIKQQSKVKWTSYLKSLFGKTSGCSSEHSAAADHRQFTVAHGGAARNVVPAPFGQIKCGKESGLGCGHRRSFSGAFKRLSKAKTTPCSNSLNAVSKRSEIDSPIQAAIAHCKRSQIGDEAAFCSTRRICD